MPHTLLLADDSATIQRVIELTFADEDVRVVTVSDGDQAIAELDRTPPDIVLADVGMPGANGYEVAKYVKNTPHLAHIPVLLLTGAFEPIDQTKATAVACDGVLAKPFEPQLVISRVKELLARPKQAASSPDVPSPAPPAPWSTIFEDSAKPSVDASAPVEFEDYFDRLGEAFSHLSPTRHSERPHPEPQSLADQIDRYSAQAAEETAPTPVQDLPLSHPPPPTVAPSPPPPPEPLPPEPLPPSPPFPSSTFSQPAPTAGPSPASEAPPPSPLPPLADVFAALLAAEQSAPPPPGTPSWPAPPPPAGAAVSEDLIEEVTRLVLARLSDRVVRETVADIVLTVADRQVREEIERIKSTIK